MSSHRKGCLTRAMVCRTLAEREGVTTFWIACLIYAACRVPKILKAIVQWPTTCASDSRLAQTTVAVADGLARAKTVAVGRGSRIRVTDRKNPQATSFQHHANKACSARFVASADETRGVNDGGTNAGL